MLAFHVKEIKKSPPGSLGRENSLETAFLQTLKMQVFMQRLSFLQSSGMTVHLKFVGDLERIFELL